MKIILAVPGHLKTVPMNDYVFKTLKSLGHEVRLFNFGSQGIWGSALKKLSRQSFNRFLQSKLVRLMQDFQPEAFLAIFGFDLHRGMLEAVQRRSIPTICWWLNDHFQLRALPGPGTLVSLLFYQCPGVPGELPGSRPGAGVLPVGGLCASRTGFPRAGHRSAPRPVVP